MFKIRNMYIKKIDIYEFMLLLWDRNVNGKCWNIIRYKTQIEKKDVETQKKSTNEELKYMQWRIGLLWVIKTFKWFYNNLFEICIRQWIWDALSNKDFPISFVFSWL